jgi:hypothetical protein
MSIHVGWVIILLIALGAFYIYKHKPMTTQ